MNGHLDDEVVVQGPGGGLCGKHVQKRLYRPTPSIDEPLSQPVVVRNTRESTRS